MASSLVIEDGTGVAGANSYVDCEDARLWASSRGMTLPTIDGTLEPLLVAAVDYLEGYRGRFQGIKTASTQSLQFPRAGVVLDGYEIASNAIPQVLINAQIQIASDLNEGVDINPNQLIGSVKRERVDVIETEYFSSLTKPILNKADAWIEPLLINSGFGISVTRA